MNDEDRLLLLQAAVELEAQRNSIVTLSAEIGAHQTAATGRLHPRLAPVGDASAIAGKLRRLAGVETVETLGEKIERAEKSEEIGGRGGAFHGGGPVTVEVRAFAGTPAESVFPLGWVDRIKRRR